MYNRICSSPIAALQFFPTAEGFYDYENNEYIYQYKDHLGNVRVSYKKGQDGLAEITDQNDYYPFGMNIPREGKAIVGVASLYNYKYNGKELQETGMYDYGARFCMPDIGRWGVVDELSEKSRRFSTYTYALDNPIMFIDPDGREAEQCCKKQLSWLNEYRKGAWSTAGNILKSAAKGTYTSVTGGIREVGKVYNAYQKGGASAAVNQHGKSVYETSGAKGLVEAGKKALTGDPHALGSLATIGAAAIITHKAGGSKGVASTEATMNELTNTVKSTASEMYASKKAPAAVVGAELNGQTTIGVSGAPPSTVAPQLEGVVNELGGLGTRTASGNPVGCCAEFNAGNQLLLNNPSATPGQINFTDAIRPRTGKVVPMCDNCKTTFEK